MTTKYPKLAGSARLLAIAAVLGLGGTVQMAVAQQNQAVDMEVLQVVPNFYVIASARGNIAAQVGPDGVVLVNSGPADMSGQIIATIKKLTPQPILLIVNTSADADNVGGNESVAKAGRSFTNNNNPGPATIVSTESVLDRMSAPSGKQALWPAAAWPGETFFEKEKPMYINHEGIQVMAQPAAHSDGDAMVFFRRSDVLVTGDILDMTRFPVIDVDKGGSIQGEIDALNHIIEIAIPSIPMVWQDGGTFVVPGRGRICDQADVVAYRDMVTIIRDIVQDMINQGKTLDQVRDAHPAEGYEKRFGSQSGPWTTSMFVEAIYRSLTAKK